MLRKLAQAATGLLVTGVAIAMAAAPASAEFTTNTIGCGGSATVKAKNGKVYQLDANAAELTAPRDGTASWSGAITTVTHNHRGAVRLKLGPLSVTLGTWGPSPNAGNESKRSGIKQIPSIVSQVPPGKYVVTGFHRGTEGGCAGKVTIDLEGSIFSTPAGIVSVAGTVLSAVVLALAARPRVA